jgi:hypothetical protein
MSTALLEKENDELVTLWRRRQALTSKEMGRLYTIVGKALRGCHPPELNSLGEDREELIAQFIYTKVLRLGVDTDEPIGESAAHSTPSNAYALCSYFRRYLIDCTRSAAFKRNVSIGDQISDDELEAQAGASDSTYAQLEQHGLTSERVHSSARAFIAKLPKAERLLLCEGFGQEAEGGLAGVASRHAIASYHYRAGRLGLVHRRQQLPTDWSRTTIGTWISTELGIEIAPENIDVIRQVFQILGAQASCA